MKKWIPLIVIVLVLFVLFGWLRGTYNTMVTQDELVGEKWAQVENVYQRKFDLIPNMVATAKNYAEFEQQTLTEVMEARSRATQLTIDPSNLSAEQLQQFQANYQELNNATFGRLLATFERYPDLKASELYLKLQDELAGSENRISTERRTFNEAVRDYNTYIRKFPQNFLAGIFGFERKAPFETDPEAKGGKVDVDTLFDQ